jgi:hypothetical protein
VGVLGAFALLLKSVLTPFVPVVYAAFVCRSDRRLRWSCGALAVLGCLGVLAPVLELNRREHGFFGIADSTSFNLYLGLTARLPRSGADTLPAYVYRDYLASGEVFADRRAFMVQRVRDDVSERGLLAVLAGQWPRQYFRLFDRESQFAAMLPGGSMAARGLGYRDPPARVASALFWLGLGFHLVVLASAPAGLARLWRDGRRGVGWAISWLAYLLVLFFFLHVDVRYRVLILPALALGAASAAVGVIDRLAGVERPVERSWRLAAAGLGAVLLLFSFGADLRF